VGLHFLRAGVLSPLPYLADFLPPVGSADAENTGRLYRVATIGLPEPSPAEHVSIREPLQITMRSSIAGERLATELPALVGRDYHWFNLGALLLIAAAALAASYAVGFQSLRRLLFLDVLMNWPQRKVEKVKELMLAKGDGCARKVLVLHPPQSVRDELRGDDRFQELSLSSDEAMKRSMSSRDKHWLVSELGADLAGQGVAERLAIASNLPGTVVVLSANDPLQELPLDRKKVWASTLERFELVELVADDDDSTPAPAQDAPCPATVTRWWFECNDTERRVLAQLALGGYATPHRANIPALETLAAKGLLDPATMTIAYDELAEFARRATTPKDQRDWAEAGRGSAWTALRVPLSTGVAALLAAVTVTKPEVGVASAVAPTLAAGLPSVLKILIEMINPKAS
jgi:hypothetical protein